MKFLLIASSALAIASGTAAQAEEASVSLSGGVDVKSQYLFDDLYVANDGPSMQPYVRATHNASGCYADLWASVGLQSDDGNEVDYTLGCKRELSEKTSVEVLVGYYDIRGTPDDIIVARGILTHGPWTVTAEHMSYRPEDGVKLMVEYTVNVNDKLAITPIAVYETGIGFPDIGVAGIQASYDVTEKFSVNGKALFAFHKADDDPRDGVEVVVGLSYSF